MNTAVLSDDGQYRYELTRYWAGGSQVAWIMLNPSTADASVDDPTIRRCIGFSQAWGFGSLIVVNLFAVRATNPKDMLTHHDPVGPDNDAYLRSAAEGSDLIVAAWGTKGNHAGRDKDVGRLIAGTAPLHCLDVTKDGHPKHPLYVKGDTQPRLYR